MQRTKLNAVKTVVGGGGRADVMKSEREGLIGERMKRKREKNVNIERRENRIKYVASVKK
jgi:hypothetical protein